MVDVFAPPPVPPRNNSPAAPVKVDNPPPSVVSRSHEPNTPAQDRWQADQDALDRMDPWRRDGKQTMLVRQADGSVVEVPRRDGGVNGEPSTGDPANPGDPGQATVEGGKLRIGELELSEADILQLMTETAAREARKATMPATAADYTLDLPADFKMPDGQSWKRSEERRVGKEC